MVSIRNVPQLVEKSVSANFGSFPFFWKKWHISHPIEQGCCFCQFWINRKCATIGRKWFLPILVLVPFWKKWHISRPIEQGWCFCQVWINRKCATIGRKRFLPILVLVPFLAEMTHKLMLSHSTAK